MPWKRQSILASSQLSPDARVSPQAPLVVVMPYTAIRHPVTVHQYHELLKGRSNPQYELVPMTSPHCALPVKTRACDHNANSRVGQAVPDVLPIITGGTRYALLLPTAR